MIAVLLVVFCEVKKLKFIMTVCWVRLPEGEGLPLITVLLSGSRTLAVVTVSGFLGALTS